MAMPGADHGHTKSCARTQSEEEAGEKTRVEGRCLKMEEIPLTREAAKMRMGEDSSDYRGRNADFNRRNVVLVRLNSAVQVDGDSV